MADLDFDFCTTVDATSELLNRPEQQLVQNQAELVGLALTLNVPILANEMNFNSTLDPSGAGAGVSFAVFSHDEIFEARINQDFVQIGEWKSWFEDIAEDPLAKVNVHYVAKRIMTAEDREAMEAEQLAAMVNELRVLANRTVRKSQNIVKLFALSWHEIADQGRFWPQLLIESAPFGTLDGYLQSASCSMMSKLHIMTDITWGLEHLHHEGIVHGDMKPSNVLIYPDPRGAKLKSEGQPIVAKICDFGCAIILSDYNTTRSFQARVGTLPYMAPEIDACQKIDINLLHKADIYSFGLMIAFVLANGRKPLAELSIEDARIAKAEPAGIVRGLMGQLAAAEPNLDHDDSKLFELLFLAMLDPGPGKRTTLTVLERWILLTSMVTLLREVADAEGIINGFSAIGLDIAEAWKIYENKVRPLISVENAPTSDLLEFVLNQIPERVYSMLSMCLEIVRGREDLSSVPSLHGEPSGFDSRSRASAESPAHGVPNFCFEPNFLSCKFPKVAAVEVYQSMHRMTFAENVDPEVWFQLAGASFNGGIVSCDEAVGIGYLTMAAEAGHLNATILYTRIAESCNSDLSADQKMLIRRMFYEEGKDAYITSKIRVMMQHPLSRPNVRDSYLVDLWSKEDPASFRVFMRSSERREAQLGLIHTLSSMRAEPVTDDADFFDFTLFDAVETALTSEWMSTTAKEAFIDVVLQNQCAEKVNEYGLTLLQMAVVSERCDMIRILLEQLNVNPNNEGQTSGWSPLWLACWTGNWRATDLLIENGASPYAMDRKTGVTVLHLLNQFSDDMIIRDLLKKVLSRPGYQKSALLRQQTNTGFTPLASTFHGYDHSGGAATKVLLAEGADPLLYYQDGPYEVPSLALCARNLDAEQLRTMLKYQARIGFSSPAAKRRFIEELALAKARAFVELARFTNLQLRSIGGARWEEKLREVLLLLVDDDMLASYDEHMTMPKDKRSPLAGCLSAGRSAVALSLIQNFALPTEQFSEQGINNALLHAIEKRVDDCIVALLEKGADLYDLAHRFPTIFHAAAHHHSEALPWIVDIVDKMDSYRRRSISVKNMFEIRNFEGQDVLALLLMKATDDDLLIVDDLRCRFRLHLDLIVEVEELSFTLTASTIIACTVTGVAPLSSIRYLMDLPDRPRYVCFGDGQTLLDLAMRGKMSYQQSLRHPGHQICKMILERYSLEHDVLKDLSRSNPIHKAAAFSNSVAIEMIMTKMKDKAYSESISARSFSEVCNILDKVECTALDRVVECLHEARNNAEGDQSEWDYRLQMLKKPAALQCYKLLRENGAVHAFELGGIMRDSKFIYRHFAPNDQQWYQMLAGFGSMLGIKKILVTTRVNDITLTHDPQDPKVIQAMRRSPQAQGKVCKFRIVELVWIYDEFALSTYNFTCSPFHVSEMIEEPFVRRVQASQQMLQRMEVITADGKQARGNPWESYHYNQSVPASKEKLKWSRHTGREWTDEEATQLTDKFNQKWKEVFGMIMDKKARTPSGELMVMATNP